MSQDRDSAPQPPSDGQSWLYQAEALVNGPRSREYGDVALSFQNVAALWSVVLGVPVTSRQVALCMIQLKTARLVTSPDHADSWIDIAGYVACAQHLNLKEDDHA